MSATKNPDITNSTLLFTGMRFALCQSKAAIVEIIRNFDLTVNEKTKLPLIFDPKEFILMPEGGYWINYKPFKK